MAVLPYGIQAIQPQADAFIPHVLGFQTARSAGGDNLFEVWNGSTDATLKFAVDKDGNLATVLGATFDGDVFISGDLSANSPTFAGDVTLSGGDLLVSGAIGLNEDSFPPAGVANRAYLYAEDNGSGKTRLVVKWPGGTTSTLATAP